MNRYCVHTSPETDGPFWPWSRLRDDVEVNLIVPDECAVQIKRFKQCYNSKTADLGLVSGVLADWLDDNRDVCLALGSDPGAIDRFVGTLRGLFLRRVG